MEERHTDSFWQTRGHSDIYGCSYFVFLVCNYIINIIIEISATSLAHNPVLICSISQLPVSTEKCYMVSWSYQNLGQIDHNLHGHVFDDIICKPLISILKI